MPTGWYGLICCICFGGLTEDTCWVDSTGQKWDVHPGECQRQMGDPNEDGRARV